MCPLFYILPPATSFKNYFLIHSVLLSFFFVLHLHTVQVLFIYMVLCKGPWFRSVYISSTKSDLRGQSTCSNPAIQSEAHTGRRSASKQSIYPLETRNKFQRQCPPSQRSSDASPWAHSFDPHTGRERGSCAVSSHSPAQNCLGPLTAYQTLRHSFSHAHFLGSPKHSPGPCLHFYPLSSKALYTAIGAPPTPTCTC